MGAELEPGARSRDELSRTGRLQNVAFIKHYYFKATSEQVQVAALLKELTAERQFVGFGDTARLRIFDWLSAKAAYEYAVRMPSIDELVGDNILVRANVDLQPETSHNVNAGLKLEKRGLQVDLGAFTLPLGGFNVGVDGFYRETDNLIAPRGDGTGFVYQNLFHVRTIGVEGNGSWTSPGSWLILEGNATIQDSRNTSTEGEFAKYVGQRVPNRPWLFFNWGARVQWRDVLVHEDELSPFYSGRSIQGFFRNWEDVGNPDFKAKIPDQMVHSAGISYSMRWPARVGLTFEIDNFLNAQTFDFFGIQRPGLSMALKGTTEF
jgi:hypothetical protein